MPDAALTVRVWGEFACFTRPEMKVERVSYPVPTPSAARGILEAIFWKPEFSWQVESIVVLKPIRYFSILRNEVNDRESVRAAQSWAAAGGGYRADDARSRAQRHTLALRDVAYLLTAQIVSAPTRDRRSGQVPRPVPPPHTRRPMLRNPVLRMREFYGRLRTAGWERTARRDDRRAGPDAVRSRLCGRWIRTRRSSLLRCPAGARRAPYSAALRDGTRRCCLSDSQNIPIGWTRGQCSMPRLRSAT